MEIMRSVTNVSIDDLSIESQIDQESFIALILVTAVPKLE